MSKMAFVGIDRVIADSSARFALAEQVASAKYEKVLSRGAWTDLYWKTALDGSHIHLGTLIPGANEALNKLEDSCDIFFLTSRPEHMRNDTLEWFKKNKLMGFTRTLVMKPASMQYVKTLVWKVGAVHMLTSMYGAAEVIVVDDEEAILDILDAQHIPFVLLRLFTSLDLQVEYSSKLPPDMLEHPF